MSTSTKSPLSDAHYGAIRSAIRDISGILLDANQPPSISTTCAAALSRLTQALCFVQVIGEDTDEPDR